MKVAVAVIINGAGRVLITRRPLKASHGGLWEFPGGKLEENETPLFALKREISEEVGLTIVQADFLTQIKHSYGSKDVELLVFCVTKYEGSPLCRESQMDMCWVSLDEINDFEFPEANKQIIDLLSSKIASI